MNYSFTSSVKSKPVKQVSRTVILPDMVSVLRFYQRAPLPYSLSSLEAPITSTYQQPSYTGLDLVDSVVTLSLSMSV